MSKKRMLVLCPYPENVAPSQRLKFEQYYESFRKAGYEVEVSPFISEAFWNVIYKKGNIFSKALYTLSGYWRRLRKLFTAGKYDIVYVHLWATPFGPPLYEWLLRKVARSVVYDIDDLVYLKNVENQAHPWVAMIKGRNKPVFLMRHADQVITCTPHLDEFVRKFNPHTTDISSTVDTEVRYLPKENYQSEKLTLGWSGSLSTSKYFYLLADVLKKLALKHQFNIRVIGDASVHIEGLDIEAFPWQAHTEMDLLKGIDIGLYPLPSEEWVLGKSGLKAIQYMALGIPTVATAIGANFRVIEDGVSGFLVNSEEEWINRLSELMEQPALREKIGRAARQRVEQLFSIQSNEIKYLKVLEQASSSR
jgi:L-malate glycosyltransferase